MIQPRYYQADAEAAIFNYYASGMNGNPVVAMPTASGKSVVIASFCKNVLQTWPRQRIIVATHVKELVQQNHGKMLEAWDGAPAGVYSAGLKQRDSVMPIIFGGIQSMVERVNMFGWRDLLLVDEAHLISGKDDSNYGKFIAGLKHTNPHLKVIGFSATPWRMGAGKISDGPVFTDVCFDNTTLEAFNKLIAEGYLCNLIPKRTRTELNVSDVKIVKGDYAQGELQTAVDKDSITHAACKEIIEQGHDRYSWLIFASGIEHSDHIAQMMNSFGVDCVSIHSKMDDDVRDVALRNFKNGRLRCVVNNNVLTTGFDHPGIDLIGDLRPTTSVVLHVQKYGRGLRPAPSKENCLVLDFAGNTKRLGPINDPVIPKKRGQREGVAPVRICEKCGTYNHARATHCINCGEKFEFAPKITHQAGTDELIRVGPGEPVVQMFNVQRVIYGRHQKDGGLPVMKVSYLCDLKMFNEVVCFEHSGYARQKAEKWWRERMFGEAPKSVDTALQHVGQLTVPRQIRVWVNKKYPEVMTAVF